jgi:hypothetical protein
MIDEEFLEKFQARIVESVEAVIRKMNFPGNKPEWVDDVEARSILGYRSKTKLQELRNNREIAFSKHGRKIRYQRSSLLNFLEKNKRRTINENN